MITEKIQLKKRRKKPWLVWLSWLEHCPIHQKVGGSIPSQGTYLGCVGSVSGQGAYVRQALMFLSHTDVSLSLPFSLKIKKHIYFLNC